MARNRRNYKGKDKSKGKDGVQKSHQTNSTVDSKDEKDLEKGKKEIINDAKWYIPEDTLREQVGSFSMSGINGVPVDLDSKIDAVVLDHNYVVPSVMGIFFNPCPGVTDFSSISGGTIQGETAPVNLAARRLYTAISAENSKTTQYQPQDLAFAVLSIGELQSLISLAYKLYGLAFTYNERNREIPRTLIKAMGCDPNSILNDMAGFRMKLNVLLVAANEIRFPADIKWFTKCWDLFSSYYIDDPSNLAQYYIPTIYSYWLLDETGSQGSELKTKYIAWNNGQHVSTWTEWKASDLLLCIEELINALLTSTTMNYVYADIINYIAKRGGEMLNFGYLPETYVIPPVYNEEFLTQVHNLRAVGMPNNTDVSHTDANDVVQNPSSNNLKYSPAWELSYNGGCHKQVLDFPFTMNPSPDDKINALMFKADLTECHEDTGTSTYIYYSPALPDHYVVSFSIYANESEVARFGGSELFAPGNALASSEVRKLIALSKFKCAPLIYFGDTTSAMIDAVFGDMNFYTDVDHSKLIQLFNYSCLGLLDFHTTSNRKR